MGLLLGRFIVAGDAAAPPAPVHRGKPTIERLQEELRTRGADPQLLTQLGVAYLGEARKTADPSWYTKAADALAQASAARPSDPSTLTALGLLDLARHDFPQALARGQLAHQLAPLSPDALGVVVDAQVELGRYDEAAESAQQMVDRRPELASLSRVSYLRELHGDTAGALTAMTQAAAAGSGSAADTAYVRTLIGDLHLNAGRLDDADAQYRRTLADEPAYGMAEYGTARVAAARGHLDDAARILSPLVTRLPFPAWVALLGDVEAARGHAAEAARQYDLVRTIEQLNRANGVAVDLEVARFEADHARDPGADAAAVVALARSALAQRPTVYAEDALGWALRQAGRPAEALPHARAAVRLGTAEASLWYHLATVEADLGISAAAAADLGRAFSTNPFLTVRDLPAARTLGAALGVTP
jgi:tetratricopeptide (TPR) repeat protein